MKKFWLLWVLFCAFLLAGCNNSSVVVPEVEESDITIEANEQTSEDYEWFLEIKGVWPEISLESEASEWSLVAVAYFEDHADHIFFPAWSRENLLTDTTDVLPWNTINFKWKAVFIDWAAWNHYYQVYDIETLAVEEYVDNAKIEDIVASYNFCETDEDCDWFDENCAFWRITLINSRFHDVSVDLMNRYGRDLDCIFVYQRPTQEIKSPLRKLQSSRPQRKVRFNQMVFDIKNKYEKN